MELPDGELLRRSAGGDERAFEMLYDRHQGAVYRFALFAGGSDSIAEEVAQDVFLAIIRQPSRFDEKRGSFAAYLCGIARNLIRQRLKADPWSCKALPDDESLISPQDVVEDLTSAERLSALRQAVLALPSHYREVVVLCHLQGFGPAETARILGCPEGTVCSRLSRARQLLTEKLKAVEHV